MAVTSGRARRHLAAYQRAAAGYVATPANLADTLARYPYANVAALADGADVLEPSAGDGAIVTKLLTVNPRLRVVAVEPDTARADALHALPDAVRPAEIFRGRFEDYAASLNPEYTDPHDDAARRFDLVVMNPPFSVPSNKTIWADHVLLAWRLLRPGGRLIAIVPNGFTFRTDKTHTAMRALVEAHGEYDELPAQTFKSEGVGVGAVVIVLDKPVLLDDVTETPADHARTVEAETVRAAVARHLKWRSDTGAPVLRRRDGWRWTVGLASGDDLTGHAAVVDTDLVEVREDARNAAVEPPHCSAPKRAWIALRHAAQEWPDREDMRTHLPAVAAGLRRRARAYGDGPAAELLHTVAGEYDEYAGDRQESVTWAAVRAALEARALGLQSADRQITPAADVPADGDAAALAVEMKRVTRVFTRYTAEQRANAAASHRSGHRQRQAVGSYHWTHPDFPGRAFGSARQAARAATSGRAGGQHEQLDLWAGLLAEAGA